MREQPPSNSGKHHRTRAPSAGYYIFRAWKLDPKTGDRVLPPEGKKAWKIWIPLNGTGGRKKLGGA
jgi:hypothetical protein